MSSYPFFSSKTAENVDLSAASDGDVLGKPIDMARLTKISVQAILTGVAGATATDADSIKLQASDVVGEPGADFFSSDDLHWVDVSSALVQLVNGTNCVTFSAADLPSRFVRIVLNKSGVSAGTANVYVTCKHG